MTSSLESRLTEELRQEAERVADVPGLAERVVARAHVVRRRRALTAAAVSGVIVVLFVAVIGGAIPHTSTLPPPAHKTPQPSTSSYVPVSLRQLPRGAPPDVDYIVGRSAHLGGATSTLPADWSVTSLVHAGDQWFVVAQTGDADGVEVVATLRMEGDPVVLDRGAFSALAVDPSGLFIAWGSGSTGASPKFWLTEYDSTTNAVVARRTVERPASVVGWAKEGVIVSYRMDPGGSPVVWDPAADTLTKVWGGSGAGPTFIAYSRSLRLWVLTDPQSGCDVVLSRVGGTAPAKHCSEGLRSDGLPHPAAFFADDQQLAAESAGSVRVLDRHLIGTGVGHPIPAGTVVMQIVPTTGDRLLVSVLDISSRSSHVLDCAGNGPCKRALDSAPAAEVVLATS